MVKENDCRIKIRFTKTSRSDVTDENYHKIKISLTNMIIERVKYE
jgi:hypothetical protein